MGELYLELKKLCRPFRLMDLPSEIRLNILEEVLEGCKIERDAAITKWTVRPSHQIPAIMGTGHQLREEALPLYLARSNFLLRLDDDKRSYSYDGFCFKMNQAVNRWSKVFPRSSTTHLRKLTLRIPFLQSKSPRNGGSHKVWHNVEADVELSFSEKNGLQIKLPENSNAETKANLEKYISEMEKKRSERLKGESIIMACRQDVGIWWYKTLWLEDE